MATNGWREGQSEFKGFAKSEFKNINSKLDVLGKNMDTKIDKICNKLSQHADKMNKKVEVVDLRSRKNEKALDKVFLIAGGVGFVFGVIGTAIFGWLTKAWNMIFK